MTALPLFDTSLSMRGHLQIALSRIAGIPLSRIQEMDISSDTMAAMLAEKCWRVNAARPYRDPLKITAG